jgi:aspartyl protease family protein
MLSTLINLSVAALLCLAALGDRTTVKQLSALFPVAPDQQPIATAPGELTLRADGRGHYLVAAKVNGRPVRFLVDTGASHTVLSLDAAESVGLRVGERDFTEIYSTPGGTVRAAPVVLREVRIGDLVVRDVRASVGKIPMEVSLLGASFLARLKGYEGEDCRECGNFTLVRNGTCLKCDTCGSTSGCS